MNKRTTLLRQRALLICLCAVFSLCASNADPATADSSLADQDIESLMKIPVVFSASKFEQKSTEAPSSTTVITSDEIKRYGWRTLGDLLESVQGFYMSYDRNYQYLGARGVNRWSQYTASNGRFCPSIQP